MSLHFISHIRKMAVTIQGERTRADGFGNLDVVHPYVVAQFDALMLSDGDIEFAQINFEQAGELNGRTTLLDEVTMSPIINRLSAFDTGHPTVVAEMAGFDEQYGPPKGHNSYLDLLEAKLLERAGPGKDFQLVADIPVAAPWPKYLDYAGTFEDLAQKVLDDGYDIATVVRFEKQTANRPELIELLEMLQRDQQTSDEFVEA